MVNTHTEIWRSTNCVNLQFAPAEKVLLKIDDWCQTLGQFTGVHFLDLNSNSNDINNVKLNLNVSTKIKFNGQGLSVF